MTAKGSAQKAPKTTLYGGDGQPAPRDIRAALAKVMASPPLAKSPQLAQFLTFIVEETLAGRGHRLKAYTIATGAFSRDAKFDPQADPIVRVEANRLRRLLERYYAESGRNDPLVIELPLGHYVPVFRASNAARRLHAGLPKQGWRVLARLRADIGYVTLVAVVAATVSLSLNLAWLLLVPGNPHTATRPDAALVSSGTTGSPMHP